MPYACAVCIQHSYFHINQYLLTRGNFDPEETFRNVWRHFDRHHLGSGVPLVPSGSVRDAAKQFIKDRKHTYPE